MKKQYALILFISMNMALLFAAGKKEGTIEPLPEKTAAAITVKVAAPYGAPAVCIAKMAAEQPAITPNSTTEYEVLQSPDALQARIISEEADIAIIPSNLAAILHAKGADIRCAGGVVWGILYGLTTETITAIQDLKGKTMVTFGRGLTPDITVREIIAAYGLIPDKDVTFHYVQSAKEAAMAFISGKETIAILPEPMVSMALIKQPSAQLFLDVQQAWKEKIGSEDSYPQAVVVIRGSLIQKHPEYVKAFLKELSDSIAWTNEHPKEASEYAEAIQKGVPAPLLTKGISRMNLHFIDAAQSKPAFQTYFSVLLKTNPKFIGGALPQDHFYYSAAE